MLLTHFFKKSKISKSIVIAPTDKLNTFYGKKYPKLCIHNEYKPNIVKNLIKSQYEINKTENEKSHCVLLLDDCEHNREF